MPNEALWIQSVGVDYDAGEDRTLIWALAQAGVARGFEIAAVAGQPKVTVNGGAAVIDDGSGHGCYLAWLTTATTLTIPAGGTSNIYVSVNTSTGATTVSVGTSAPTSPYLTLGSAAVAAGASVITSGSVVNSAPKAVPPSIGADFMKSSGATMTGRLQSPDVLVPGIFQANSAGVNAPDGVKLGGAYPTARVAVNRTLVANNGADSTYAACSWTGGTMVSDYAGSGMSAVDHICPVSGDYLVSGYVVIDMPDPRVDFRLQAIVTRINSDGSGIIRWPTERVSNPGSSSMVVAFSHLISAVANQRIRIETWQNSGKTLGRTSGRFAMRLVQAN